MFERFTDPARAVLVQARKEAQQLGHGWLGTEHILLGLLSPEAGLPYDLLRARGLEVGSARVEVARLAGASPKLLSDDDAAALRTVGIDAEEVMSRIGRSFGPEALKQDRRGRRRKVTPRAKKVLQLALGEAIRLHHDYIGAEHIVLGLLREGKGKAVVILRRAGVDPDELRQATVAALTKAA